MVMSDFEAKLQELVKLGNKNKGILESSQVADIMKDVCPENKTDKVYDYLEAKGILVVTKADDGFDPEDAELMEMDDDMLPPPSDDEMNEIADALSDDPVKQYLREIGSYALLSAEEEVELAPSEDAAVRAMRSVFSCYVKGMKGAAGLKDRLCRASTVEEVEDILWN